MMLLTSLDMQPELNTEINEAKPVQLAHHNVVEHANRVANPASSPPSRHTLDTDDRRQEKTEGKLTHGK
jgi:hypothetical protein